MSDELKGMIGEEEQKKSHEKLVSAMAAIKGILTVYDIAGVVVLHAPGAAEFHLKLNPSYSCLTVVGDAYRLKAKAADLGGPEMRDKMLAATANMMSLLAEVTGKKALDLMHLADIVDGATGAEHTDTKKL